MKTTLTIIVVSLLLIIPESIAQKKALDHSAYDIWQQIRSEQLSRDGKWIAFYLSPAGDGDPTGKVHSSDGQELITIPRGSDPSISFDSRAILFTVSQSLKDSKEMRRNGTKQSDLPADSLVIYYPGNGQLVKIPSVKSHKIPEKWGGWVAYQIEPVKKDSKKDQKSQTESSPEEAAEETAKSEATKSKKSKAPGKDNGYHLVLRNLETSQQDTFRFVKDYLFSKEGSALAFSSTGDDEDSQPGIYQYDVTSQQLKSILTLKGDYSQLSLDEKGRQLTFIADFDTTKKQIRPFELYYSKNGNTATRIAGVDTEGLPSSWVISSDFQPRFSKDGKRLFFGSKPPPVEKDTSLLDEEIVKLEIWSHSDPKLHTQQKVDLDEDMKKAYTVLYDTESGKVTQLGSEAIPEVNTGNEGKSPFSIGENDLPYLQKISWEGGPAYRDVYLINNTNGNSELVASGIRGNISFSPQAKYMYWYNRNDSAWFTYSVAKRKIFQVTNNQTVPFFNELNDTPNFPSPYGLMSWTENDEKILIYSRYDIWEIDPESTTAPRNVTENGRSSKTTYRYVRLDDEERFVSKGQTLMIRGFHENDKSESLNSISYGKPGMKLLTSGPYRYRNLQKAQGSNDLIYSRQNFREFPDLHASTMTLKKSVRVSNANPQQAEYNWGTAELVTWTSLDGRQLEGMLFKPDNFDPSRKYPLMVNFYERSSHTLNAYRVPSAGGSSVNYSFYVSRGYVVFNPNVEYRIGYPGESAYDCVIPGVTALIDKGYIDKDRIGVQGHSWGGYQISYLVTKSDLFACAEAGAPVVNMISAYGGIRWGSGLSRMFQYERTQSRLGATLWEVPLRYIENSPIFFADKINTPLMYMHNDADTAVPWYQGIEFFVALRRLGKPVWMLNYQGEPHGLRKQQNRKDFAMRMQQFFDYYLLDAPMPKWMRDGIPATEVGIRQALEPVEADKH